jgi:DNA repair exonuclease SbcCD ATPase subunit
LYMYGLDDALAKRLGELENEKSTLSKVRSLDAQLLKIHTNRSEAIRIAASSFKAAQEFLLMISLACFDR